MGTAGRSFLDVAREGKILIVAIDNPPHNYLSSGFLAELFSFKEILKGPDVDAIIFTGRGNVFSKGADIDELKSGTSAVDKQMIIDGNEVYTFISDLSKPVVAAINGACFGGGLELALACHLRVCSEKARLGLPEVSLGLIPGLGGITRLTRVVGESKALEMILLGDMIPAARAYELNLVSRVFPKTDFMGYVLSFVKTLLTARKQAITEAIRLVTQLRPEHEARNIAAAAEGFMRLLSSRIR
jgi:enoyl-CoA hydratase